MLAKCLNTFYAVLVQGFDLTVLIKVIEHQVPARILALTVVIVVTKALACPSGFELCYLLAT